MASSIRVTKITEPLHLRLRICTEALQHFTQYLVITGNLSQDYEGFNTPLEKKTLDRQSTYFALRRTFALRIENGF